MNSFHLPSGIFFGICPFISETSTYEIKSHAIFNFLRDTDFYNKTLFVLIHVLMHIYIAVLKLIYNGPLTKNGSICLKKVVANVKFSNHLSLTNFPWNVYGTCTKEFVGENCDESSFLVKFSYRKSRLLTSILFIKSFVTMTLWKVDRKRHFSVFHFHNPFSQRTRDSYVWEMTEQPHTKNRNAIKLLKQIIKYTTYPRNH